MPDQTLREDNQEINQDGAIDVEPPEVEYNMESLYHYLRNYVRAVAQGYQRSMMLESPHGIGKSYTIEDELTEVVDDNGYVKIAGHSSPLALYQTLQDNKDKVIFLDDCSAVLQDRQAMEIIKAATETEVDERWVSWNSNTHELNEDYDESFRFEGQLIICANKIPDRGNTKEIVDSMIDRSIMYRLDFSYQQRIDLIKQVAYVHETDIEAEDRMMIAGWIENVTGPDCSGVNLRTLFKCFNMYRYDEENWKELASELLTIDPELAFIKNELEECDSVEEARRNYEEEFDKSRATFYRKKRKLEENLE